MGSGEIYLDTLEFEFVTSPFRNEHTNFIARHPLVEYNKTQITELKDCNFPSIEYGGRQTQIYMQVISKGRTYFHETPHNETRIKDLFLIPGDKVTPDYRDGDFTFVWYTQKSGNQVSGWLKTEDLMEIPPLD